ncbi:DUF882 domain-containing protein [Marinobacterium weihaiense]|uniref:DUF882 domain-containing protein n=1 Tax=Marinobacterium weihaiense TaxID=2851016 RepID=A0ABS6M807_9GAMM|nr:DUF882 domain-containing protein [Marinobacterium weihaiense]MBV0932421.1 DUF882 domain-containing protein [Marinobacterium weihaiense]
MLLTPRRRKPGATAEPRCRQRRRLLGGIAGAATLLHLPKAHANIQPLFGRELRFDHLHTGERLHTTYWAQGDYVRDSLADINHLLRDFRTGEEHPIDPRLLDLLHRLKQQSGNDNPFQIISGYRSPRTNARLRAASNGVAQKSLHMQGQALDIRLPGTPLKELHRLACDAKVGGVGLYTRSNFIHIDTGRVRYWGG